MSDRLDTISAYERWLEAASKAIDNMISEMERPIDSEASGSARKAEIQSVKLIAMDATELLTKYRKMESELKELKEDGDVGEDRDFKGGMAEKYAK